MLLYSFYVVYYTQLNIENIHDTKPLRIVFEFKQSEADIFYMENIGNLYSLQNVWHLFTFLHVSFLFFNEHWSSCQHLVLAFAPRSSTSACSPPDHAVASCCSSRLRVFTFLTGFFRHIFTFWHVIFPFLDEHLYVKAHSVSRCSRSATSVSSGCRLRPLLAPWGIFGGAFLHILTVVSSLYQRSVVSQPLRQPQSHLNESALTLRHSNQ